MLLKDELRKIAEMQKYDSQIFVLSQQNTVELPGQLETLKREVEERKKGLAQFDEAVKASQLKKKEKELDLKTKEESVKKAQAALYQLKTNREYQAKLTEIASLKADISLLEEDILKAMDALSQKDGELAKAKEQFSKEEKEIKEKQAKINVLINENTVKIQEMQNKKNVGRSSVDEKILSRYEKLIETRAGIAIAPVENGNCGACHMWLPHQIVNEIQMYKGLVFCESCSRILYIPEDIG